MPCIPIEAGVVSGRIGLMSVAPIGTRRGGAFVDGPGVHEFRILEFPVYPPSPHGERLRKARVGAGLTLRAVAHAVDLRPREVCDLERGSSTTDDVGWAAIMAAIERLRR